MVLHFDENGSTMVLDMMRSMSFLLGLGLGCRRHESREFIAAVDHDVPFGLGFFFLQRPITDTWRFCTRRESELVCSTCHFTILLAHIE